MAQADAPKRVLNFSMELSGTQWVLRMSDAARPERQAQLASGDFSALHSALAGRNVRGIAPYFIVDDVVKSAEWYRDKLGFGFERLWGEPPCFAMVKRDGIVIMLSQPPEKGQMRPNSKVHEETCWDAYVWVSQVDALYEEFKNKGVKIAREIENKFYGCRDFDIEDCNGYVLCFGQDLG